MSILKIKICYIVSLAFCVIMAVYFKQYYFIIGLAVGTLMGAIKK